MYQPEDWFLYLTKSDEELTALSRVDFFRGSGKGGQKKNKTSNAVRLVLGTLIVTDSSSRSRTTNLQRALRKLRLKIAFDYKNSVQFRGDQLLLPEKIKGYFSCGNISINKKNSDYPLLIGYLINIFISTRGNYKEAALFCNMSPSQLRKFVGKDSELVSNFKQISQLFSSLHNQNSQDNKWSNE